MAFENLFGMHDYIYLPLHYICNMLKTYKASKRMQLVQRWRYFVAPVTARLALHLAEPRPFTVPILNPASGIRECVSDLQEHTKHSGSIETRNESNMHHTAPTHAGSTQHNVQIYSCIFDGHRAGACMYELWTNHCAQLGDLSSQPG